MPCPSSSPSLWIHGTLRPAPVPVPAPHSSLQRESEALRLGCSLAPRCFWLHGPIHALPCCALSDVQINFLAHNSAFVPQPAHMNSSRSWLATTCSSSSRTPVFMSVSLQSGKLADRAHRLGAVLAERGLCPEIGQIPCCGFVRSCLARLSKSLLHALKRPVLLSRTPREYSLLRRLAKRERGSMGPAWSPVDRR